MKEIYMSQSDINNLRYKWLRGDTPESSSRWQRLRLEYWNGEYWEPMKQEELDSLCDDYIMKSAIDKKVK